MSEAFTAEVLEAGRLLFAKPTRFIMGVAALEQLPPGDMAEIAFAGRSNAGKSSLINALTGVNGLARASNTPGRTRELNMFDVDEGRLRIVDMPGYGYAKAARKEARSWQRLMKDYLRGRIGLKRVFVLIDARHGALTADKEMFGLLDSSAVSYQLVLTKIDKINAAELAETLGALAETAKKRAAALPAIHVTSSVKGTGLAELRAEIVGLAADAS